MENKKMKILFLINYILFILIIVFSLFSTCKLFAFQGKYFSFSFYLSFISIPLFYICYFFIFKSQQVHFIFPIVGGIFISLFLSSLGNTFVLYPDFNNYMGINVFRTFIYNSAKYFYDLLLIPIFLFFVINSKKSFVIRFARIFIIVWVCFCGIQFLVFKINNDLIYKLYDYLDFLKILGARSNVLKRVLKNYGEFRLYGFSTEPSACSFFICIFVLPFLFYEMKTLKNKKQLLKTIIYIEFFLSLVFLFLTKSATGYAGLSSMIIVGFIYFIKSKIVSKPQKLIILVGIALVIAVFFALPITRNIFVDKFLAKIFDKTNYSTQHRFSILWNDLNVFIKFPIFGVGGGQQGLFYVKNVYGTWMSRNPETQMAIRGELGLIGGGSFLLDFISSFGTLGIFILFKNFFLILKKAGAVNSVFVNNSVIYFLCFWAIIVISISSLEFHRNYLMFLFICSPFICAANPQHFGDFILDNLTSFKDIGKFVNIEYGEILL